MFTKVVELDERNILVFCSMQSDKASSIGSRLNTTHPNFHANGIWMVHFTTFWRFMVMNGRATLLKCQICLALAFFSVWNSRFCVWSLFSIDLRAMCLIDSWSTHRMSWSHCKHWFHGIYGIHAMYRWIWLQKAEKVAVSRKILIAESNSMQSELWSV